MGPEHLDDLIALRSDPRVSAWFDGVLDRASAAESLVLAREEWETLGIASWSAYRSEDGAYVGQGGARQRQLEGAQVVELGWSIVPELWGRGYATELGAAGADLAFARTEVDEVIAFTLPHNERSRAVMEKLGLRYVRDIQYAERRHVLYAISRDEWRRRRQAAG